MNLKRSSFLKSRQRRRRLLGHEKMPQDPRTLVLIRLLLGALVLAAVVLCLPLRLAYEAPTYIEGAVSGEEIIAPFTFDVPKPSQELDLEQARAAEGVLPAFVTVRKGPAFGSVLKRLEEVRKEPGRVRAVSDSLFLNLGPTALALLASPDSGRVLLREADHLLQLARTTRIVGAEDADLLRSYNRVRVHTPEGEDLVSTGQVWDLERLSDRAWEKGVERLGSRGADALSDLVRALASPNLVYDHAATEADRQTARSSVSPTRTTILKGERIVDASERITSDQVVVLEALQGALLHRSSGRGFQAWLLPILGRALLVFVFLSLTAGFLKVVRPQVWEDLGHLTLMTVVSVLILAIAGIVARSEISGLLVPIPLAAVVVTLLVGNLPALCLVMGLAGLVGSITAWGLSVTLIGGVGGIIACYAVQNVFHRMDFLRSIVPIAMGMISIMLGLHLVGPGTSWQELVRQMVLLTGNAVLSIALGMFILPIFEKGFGLASNITLLELSDLNRPIFKRMMLEANGTYHHSMIVGSLAEAASERVGANPLLARVGGYYHDIGKIAKSGYFGENLRDGLRNPHEKLTPHMSSLILESHVREGLELAREIGLPREVAAFIPEHQGTTLMQYFFKKAQDMDAEVEERDFRYPGPRPQTKETAVVMLADGAEALVRSLSEHSPKKIRGALARLFETRIGDGQLDDCGLTMSDLNRIKDAFTHVLTGVFHGRVKYQWQKDGGEATLGETKGTRVFHPELETAIGTREASGEHTGTPQKVQEVQGG